MTNVLLKKIQLIDDLSVGSDALLNSLSGVDEKRALGRKSANILRPFEKNLTGKILMSTGDYPIWALYLTSLGLSVTLVETNPEKTQLIETLSSQTVGIRRIGGLSELEKGEAFSTLILSSDITSTEALEETLEFFTGIDIPQILLPLFSLTSVDNRRVLNPVSEFVSGWQIVSVFFSRNAKSGVEEVVNHRATTHKALQDNLTIQRLNEQRFTELQASVLLRKNSGEDLNNEDLVCYYSDNRREALCKITKICARADGELYISRAKMFSGEHSHEQFSQVIEDEKFVEGCALTSRLKSIQQTNWGIAEICDWSAPWIEALKKHAKTEKKGQFVPQNFVDYVPFNLMLSEGNLVTPFDLEYVYCQEIPIETVVFRGLYYSLLESEWSNFTGTQWQLSTLVIDIMTQLDFKLSHEDIKNILSFEDMFQSYVAGPKKRSYGYDMWMKMIENRSRGIPSFLRKLQLRRAYTAHLT
ncbi:MAG: hypothetical protein ABJN40_18010 [Sneathiella sp.]